MQGFVNQRDVVPVFVLLLLAACQFANQRKPRFSIMATD